ncbi:hypothetical protein SAMN04515675_5343 [Pseudomonas costantinii]|uniref:Uncharacterized protein n=1 Tax=Pseudomonas costantinii TaxID=168469 RepID=A0A1H5IJ11_9PSED|nr:hypothetical protein SAMN04515675_5343 [Pseudomonas costantinii]
MAIHANCTKTENRYFFKLLIYKKFLKITYWHNHCTYHSMLANLSQRS